MPKQAKRKPASKPSATAPTSSTPSSDVPNPFIKAPSNLEAFLSNLPRDHFYIASLDYHDLAFKRRLFTVPLFMNIFLTILVLYRIYRALPTYSGIFLSILGYDSPQKVDVSKNAATALVGIGVERTFMFLGDFILLRFVGVWPWDFFLGMGIFSNEAEASPVAWRRSVHFRDTEIIIRRSRRWDSPIFYKENISGTDTVNAIEEVLAQGSESKVFQERIVPAVEKQWVKQKTGYQMLDKSWDLYFSGMIEAHALVDGDENDIDDFRTRLLVYTERWGWLVWEIWRDHEEGSDIEGSKRLQSIKDALTAMRKENLFFRSIEIIQNETSQSGPVTSEKRDNAVRRIREEFEDQDVDFDEFWSAVGGIESMPGLEVSG